MKKSTLLAMPKLTATPEMKQAAIADEPKQHESPYLSWPAGQQEQNVKLHRRQIHRLAGLPNQPALRVNLQRAKEQRCVCGGGHRGEVCNRSKN